MHVHSGDLRALRSAAFTQSNYGELTNRLAAVFHDDGYAQHLKALLDASLLGDDPSLTELARTEEDRLYLHGIRTTRSMTCEAGADRLISTHRREIRISRAYDVLVNPNPDWNLCRTLNYLSLSGIKPRRRIALLTSIGNEGINLLEWIAHYRNLGIESFFIYKNDNDDGSDRLLEILATAGILTVIDNEVGLSGVDTIQSKIFEHALNFVPEIWDHEWLLFVDPDEFLVLDDFGSLPALVEQLDQRYPGNPAAAVAFNWKWFGSNGELRRTPGLTLERYTCSRPSAQVKTLFRIREVTGWRSAHLPRLMNGGFLVDSAFEVINPAGIEVGPVYGYGQINHYWNKSFEEFLAKSKRGNWDRDFKLFFQWGNMDPGVADPLPGHLVSGVEAELQRLMSIPGVREQSVMIEQRFIAMIGAFDREHSIERLYAQAKHDASSP